MVSDGSRVTLARIAAEAGVSLATISKVLNGRPDVSAATRDRVEEQLRRHGYTRRSGAARSEYVELVVHELESSWTLDLIDGVQSTARAAGHSVVLTISGDRHSPADGWVEEVLRRRPAGVVLVFSDLAREHREKLSSRGIPFVIVDPSGDPSPEVPAVGSANWSGGLLATRHLIELGHRRIAVVAGPPDMMCSLARVDGYRSAMAAAGLPISPDWLRCGDFHTVSGERAARELLAAAERPTAIFAGSDLQALGVLTVAQELGVRVPQDLSLVGYDDIPVCRWVNPPLTTVHQPLRLMGEEATRMVLRLAEGERPDTTRMDLAVHLVVRRSTAAPGG